jgi:hypothetical protein
MLLELHAPRVTHRIGVGLCKILHTNFYEKALFVKPTWRLLSVAECNGFFSALRAMLLSALPVSSHFFASSVHYEIRLDSDYLRRCNLPSGLSS